MMQVLVSGSSGLIGGLLIPRLRLVGHTILMLHRHRPTQGDQLQWDPLSGKIDWGIHSATPIDAVIHLAGENIGAHRWSAARKFEFRSSRVEVTSALIQTLLARPQPPSTFIGASAIGIYGEQGEDWIDEQSLPGKDFLAQLALDWEMASTPLTNVGCRVVNARFGMVLSRNGGAFAKMLTPFRFGFGGQLGTGRQWMSWISLEDCVSALIYALDESRLSGAINVVSPEPVRNVEFTQTLARTLHRPNLMRMPQWVLRIVFGEMADSLLLKSQRVAPTRLLATGFNFSDARLEPLMIRLLNNRSPTPVRNPD